MTKNSPEVYSPKNIKDLLSIYNSNPGALLFAGGTSVMSSRLIESRGNRYVTTEGASVESIISLEHVEDLKRIVRKERYLEIGSMVSLSKILSLGYRVIPHVFYKSLLAISSLPVRNMATLGGGLCSANSAFYPLPALAVLDARVELRSKTKARWLSVTEFLVEEGITQISVNEVLTRIRIPYSEWDMEYFKNVGEWGNPDSPVLNFCALARVEKGVIEDVRIALGGFVRGILRDRKFELSMTGLKVPLADRERESLVDKWRAVVVSEKEKSGNNLGYQVKTALKIFKTFVERLVFLNYTGFNI